MKNDKKHIPDPLYFVACKKMYEQRALSRAEKDAILVERKRTTSIISANKKPKIEKEKISPIKKLEKIIDKDLMKSKRRSYYLTFKAKNPDEYLRKAREYSAAYKKRAKLLNLARFIEMDRARSARHYAKKRAAKIEGDS